MMTLAKGQELNKFVDAFKEKLGLICVKEMWLKPTLKFVLPGYVCLWKDRNTSGGVCAVFVRKGIQYRSVL